MERSCSLLEKNNSSSHGATSDRFIPSLYSHRLFRLGESTKQVEETDNSVKIGILVREDMIFARAMEIISPSMGQISLDREFDKEKNSPKKVEPQSPIADALGLFPDSRVLSFSPTRVKSKLKKPSNDIAVRDDAVFGSLSFLDSFSEKNQATSSAREETRIRSISPYRVLDSPGLREDYYSNLISWSTSTGNVAIGLGSILYMWSESLGATPLQNTADEQISCVSFSMGDYLAVGTMNGTLILFSQNTGEVISIYQSMEASICCISWFSDSKRFYAGYDHGEVAYFELELVSNKGDISLFKTYSFTTQRRQICGIAINSEGSQIAIGGNDNSVTIWNIENSNNPVLKYVLAHSAAIKALAFCPWSKSLLVTGGGLKDKTIKFWHTNSGTLVHSIYARAQITSLIWSKTERQIAATFGFPDKKNPTLLTVYSYPKLVPLIQAAGRSEWRALSAVVSKDGSCICVATSDKTIRFYKLWPSRPGYRPRCQSSQVFGSDLIELYEGIDKNGGSIR